MSALLARQYELMACLDAKTVAKTMGLSMGESPVKCKLSSCGMDRSGIYPALRMIMVIT
jgi:hypothetical protein